MRHNKKRNTAFLYEVLLREGTKAAIEKNIDKVKIIKVEKIVDETLIEENGSDAVMIRAAIDINSDKIVDHWVGFVATKLVYETDSGHEWAINNLQTLVELNNA